MLLGPLTHHYSPLRHRSAPNFRNIPTPRNDGEVLPETFCPFLLGNPAERTIFMPHYAHLPEASFWQANKYRILAGHVYEVMIPYDRERRFKGPG